MCELTISQKHIITERNNSKGEYQPAFMQIRIHNSFDGNIDELDVPTLGTLVHEYIHFLQNVSTPWGLYDSMVRYNIRRCVKMHTFCFLRTKPRLLQAGALLLPKDFVSLGIRISL